MAQIILPKIASEMLWSIKSLVKRGKGMVLPGRGRRRGFSGGEIQGERKRAQNRKVENSIILNMGHCHN